MKDLRSFVLNGEEAMREMSDVLYRALKREQGSLEARQRIRRDEMGNRDTHQGSVDGGSVMCESEREKGLLAARLSKIARELSDVQVMPPPSKKSRILECGHRATFRRANGSDESHVRGEPYVFDVGAEGECDLQFTPRLIGCNYPQIEPFMGQKRGFVATVMMPGKGLMRLKLTKIELPPK